MWGFHAWIDDHDHNWHEGNALFECHADGTAGTVFYDYGHSLMHQWKPPAPAPVRNWTAKSGPFAMLEAADMSQIIERIEQFPVKDLESIITRIPAECLAPDLGKSLIAGLTDGRAQVGDLLKGAP
jgi:hypothetical protein